jgi:iron complex transport system ATP-binding protein
MSALEARTVEVKLNQNQLLHAVSLSISPGALVAVIGPNGAGKSTLLRVLSGDLVPSSGDVYLLDRSLRTWLPIAQARVRGVLPQQSNLSFAFTAREVVLLGRTPYSNGNDGPHDRTIARLALATVQAEHLADRWYTTLSGGERQRVQLARVLAQIWEPCDNQPRFLLLDEPTNSLDIAHQHEMLALARQWSRNGVGVLAVLHDLNLAAQYADRIVLLHHGQVVANDTPQQVFTPDLIARVFGLQVQIMPHPTLRCPMILAHAHTPSIIASDVTSLVEKG